MKITFSHKKIFCLFILAVSLLLCLGAFCDRQIAHATTSQIDTADQLDSADQKTSSFTFQKKMSFKVLRQAVLKNEIDNQSQVPVKTYIGDTEQKAPTTMNAGVINENTVPKITGARFVGAYVEFPKTGKEPQKETQIYYTGRYSESAGDTADQNKRNYYTYYAYTPTPETGVLLEGNAYIKLLYEATYDLSYRVEDEQGHKLSDGLKEGDIGGYFVTPTTKLTQGTQLNIHFIPQRKASVGGKDYQLKKLYMENGSTKTEISFDSDDSAKTDISANGNIVAVVSPVTKYRMHVVNPYGDHHGYICWKGYAGYYDPVKNEFEESVNDDGELTNVDNVKIHAIPVLCDPSDKACVGTVKDAKGNIHGVRYLNNDNADPDFLYTHQDQFCSYTKAQLNDEKGNVVNKAGDIATTTAAPGGTFYFVMYSQCGDDWEFSRLSINGVALEAIYDGKVHDTKLKNGMVAHFKFDRYEDYKNYDVNYDLHLEKDRENKNKLFKNNKRLKFECWVSNASSDINVDFTCDGEKNESLTLTKAQGIKRIVASSYDEDHHGKLWWDSLYNGQPYYRKYDLTHWREYNDNDQKNPRYPDASPDYEYKANASDASGQLPRDLFNENDHGNDRYTEYHTKMEDRPDTDNTYLYRYLYYDTLPGYDERTTKIHITGASDNSSHDVNYGSITLVPQSYYKKDQDNKANKALSEAILDGYTNYIQYYSKSMRHRNIEITTDPYKYRAVYDLDGGMINGQSKYTDPQEYTIEKDANHILMPTATPVKKGYVFNGWQYTPLNCKYDDQKASLTKTFMPNEKYVIDDTTYDYGLDTEKKDITYSYYDPTADEEKTTTKTFYVDKENAKPRFVFKAKWVQKGDLPAGKSIYKIFIYKEIKNDEFEQLKSNGKYIAYDDIKDHEDQIDVGMVTERFGHKYKIVSANDYLGTDGKTIIGIPPEADAGYTLKKDDSTLKLANFMNDGNTDDLLQYFYNFNGTQNLTIKNVISGNMANPNQVFDVVITLKKGKTPFTGTKNVTGTNASIWGDSSTEGTNAKGTLKFDENGQATVHFKGNMQLIIHDVDIGSFIVKQKDQNLYTTRYQLGEDGEKTEKNPQDQIEDNENPIVTIYNVHDVPETGINIPNKHPGQMILLMMTSCGAFYLVYKRNERRIKRMILVATLKIEDMIKVHHK